MDKPAKSDIKVKTKGRRRDWCMDCMYEYCFISKVSPKHNLDNCNILLDFPNLDLFRI